jgi:uncharacterized protein
MLARLDDMEADHGPRSVAAGTTRLCVVTRAIKPIDAMIRFVLAPDGSVMPDLKRRLPGRGVWVTGQRSVLAAAVERGAFRRGFKSNTTVSKDLLTLIPSSRSCTQVMPAPTDHARSRPVSNGVLARVRKIS